MGQNEESLQQGTQLKADRSLGTYALQVSQNYLNLLLKLCIDTDKLQSEYLGEPTSEDFIKSYGHTQGNLLIEFLRWLSFNPTVYLATMTCQLKQK